MSTPPIAPRHEHIHTDLGVHRPDCYHWLKDRSDPETIAYLEAENAFTTTSMAHTDTLREKLYDEMLGRIQEDDTSAPARRGEYWYYHRTVSGKAYPIHCRRAGSMEAEEEVILDVNALAEGQEYLNVSSLTISPDHRLLAWLQDDDGAERRVRRLREHRRRGKRRQTDGELPDHVREHTRHVDGEPERVKPGDGIPVRGAGERRRDGRDFQRYGRVGRPEVDRRVARQRHAAELDGRALAYRA